MVVKAVQLATVGGGSSKGASLPEVGKKGRAESAGNKLPKVWRLKCMPCTCSAVLKLLALAMRMA